MCRWCTIDDAQLKIDSSSLFTVYVLLPFCHHPFKAISPTGDVQICICRTGIFISVSTFPFPDFKFVPNMKRLNNRAESHLSGQVECELDSLGKGSWVNQGYCGSPPPLPRVISTVYNPQPHFHGSFNSMSKLNTPDSFPVKPDPLDMGVDKTRPGCCSFFKGRNWFKGCFR